MTDTKVIPIVQNVDRAIAARDYTQFGNDLLITSTFVTIQGEGPYAGYPAVFVRLAGCNFGNKEDRCSWCDTSFQFDKGERITPTDLLARVLASDGYHPSQVLVITGGEPTLQHRLIDFLILAKPHFSAMQIETNGTQPKFFTEAIKQQILRHIDVVVSPKASKRTGYAKLPELIAWHMSCLKFVVTADADDPHHEVPEWALRTGKPVYVSPMTVYLKEYQGEVSSVWEDGLIDKQATGRNYAYAAAYALKHNIRISMQTHTFMAVA